MKKKIVSVLLTAVMAASLLAGCGNSSKPAESKPATTGAINLPATGTYTFTGRASIKAEAKVSSPELAYYDKGMSVNYEKVLTADGHQWLSYMTVSGARRYVDIA